MVNVEEAASWPHEDMPAAEPRSIRAPSRPAKRAIRAAPQAGPTDAGATRSFRDATSETTGHGEASAAGSSWRQVRILPLKDDAARFVAAHEDLTEVARSQTGLRLASEQLLSARRQERERIAVELHDSTGRRLAPLGAGLARLRRLTGASAAARGILDDMDASIDEAAKEIRVMSYLMKPPSLHRDGLEATARRYVKGFGSRTGLAAAFRCEGSLESVGTAIQHAAFRVVQEALSNVHRHARASAVEVELAARREELSLRIADDGAGIAPLRRARIEGFPPGVGIAGMRSRVEHLGGRFDIASDRAGTVVTARIPLPHFPTIPDGLADPASTTPARALREAAVDAPGLERLLLAQEAERRRIALELHDSTSQHLVAANLGLARLRRVAHASRAERRVIDEMSRALQDALGEIRTFSYLMNPPQLERDGLEATVRRFAAGFQTRTGMQTRLTVSGAPDLESLTAQHTLFRVLQEALTNLHRHAGAARVMIALARRAGWITLTVADDRPAGPGCEDQMRRAPVGVGIAGMHAPVVELGGTLRVTHGADGAQVIARLPVGAATPANGAGRPRRLR